MNLNWTVTERISHTWAPDLSHESDSSASAFPWKLAKIGQESHYKWKISQQHTAALCVTWFLLFHSQGSLHIYAHLSYSNRSPIAYILFISVARALTNNQNSVSYTRWESLPLIWRMKKKKTHSELSSVSVLFC